MNSVWMIDPSFVTANAGLIMKLVKGEEVSFYHQSSETSKKTEFPEIQSISKGGSGTVNFAHIGYGTDWDKIPKGSIAIIGIQGVITKNTQVCGPAGTLEMMHFINKAEESKNIGAILFDIDSPGGEATNIETFANRIRAINKPTIAVYNGTCASAAWFAAAACDEIYATESTDIIGSTGTLISFMDMIPFLEEKGIKYHEVYADQSKLKNKVFKEALNGNYEPLKQNLLNPYAESFINKIKEYRPQIKESSVFEGATFMAEDALRIGMIDGILSFNDVLLRADSLVYEKSNLIDSNKENFMKEKNVDALLSLLGYDEIVVDETDNTSTFHLNDLVKINEALESLQSLKDKNQAQLDLVESVTSTMAKTRNEIEQLNNDIANIKAENELLKAENNALGNSSTASSSTDVSEDIVEKDADQKVLEAINKKVKDNLSSEFGIDN